MSQDPSKAFDFSSLTTYHNTAYDTPLGIILTHGWFFLLGGAVLLFVLQRYDPNRDYGRMLKRLTAGALILLAGPPAAAWVIDYTGGDSEGIPHVVGYFQGAKASDSDAELVQWAEARYGISLTLVQADELQERKFAGLFVTSTETRPVLMNSQLIHGLIAADQIVLVSQDGKELSLRQ